MDVETRQHLTSTELIELGAVDREFYSRTFFPRTVRQAIPAFHSHMWDLAESSARLVNFQVFRGGAKTSHTRMYASKRIAYGQARTVLVLGKSEGHAIRTVKWLRRQIDFNKLYANTFQLSPGGKWQDVECEIIHGIGEHTVTVLALGITGSVRGVNVEDYRPDLILLDDVIDEENSATPDQRQKINALIYGAIRQSLAPSSESPDAKMIMTQTPLNREDASVLALADPEWVSARYACWTPETESAPLELQQSIWPERYPSETLRKEKQAAIARNQLSIWLREMECRIVSPETSAFKPEWLQRYDEAPEGMTIMMAIDPVPPPSPVEIAKGLRKKDFEVIAIVGRKGSDFFLLDYVMNRGHEPSWTIAEVFRLYFQWHPRRVVVESVAYQRTLAWLIRKAMEHQRVYFPVEEVTDRRRKFERIVDSISGLAANRRFHVRASHSDFISQFNAYPDVANDDLLDAVSMATAALSGIGFDYEDFDDLMDEEKDIPRLTYARGAP